MLPVLQKGETIAVLNREKTEAISAITFLARSNSAVVLFLATLTNYTSLGMAPFLFSLSHKVIWVRGKGTIHMYLKAHKELNETAWKFYINRRFRELPKSPNIRLF
jgi:hypothetical protein